MVQSFRGIIVQGTWTEPFNVIDKRITYVEKRHPPYLSSEVWRLVKITRKGGLCDHLKNENIETLKDFLFWFHVDPEGLKQILLVGDRSWKTIVAHAETCIIDNKSLFSHKSAIEPQMHVIYDVVGNLKGVVKDNRFVQSDNLPADEKDHARKLLRSVLKRPAFGERYNTSFIEEMRELCNPIFVTFPDPKFTGGTPTDLDYEKHGTPSLFDEVSQLVNISRDGEIHKCLQDNEINTVEEFLIRLLIDHEKLNEIVNLEREEWEATVSNAQACLPHSRMYCYTSLELNKGVVFNVLGHILGLCFKNRYNAASMLSEKHKADAQELLACACKNWVDVKPLDDMDHLQQHLTDLGTRVGSLPTSEMVEESRSGHSNTSFPSMSPTMEYGNYEEDDYWGKYERCPGPHSPDPMSYFADDTRIYGHQDEPGGDKDLKKHNSPNVSGNISGSRKR